MLYKEIRLVPTLFYLDVFIGKTKELPKIFNNFYGASVDYYKDTITPLQVCTINSTHKSKFNGEIRIVLNVKNFDIPILFHEINHVLWHLHKLTGIELNYNSQEWSSYFLENIYNEIIRKDNYIIL